MQYKFLLDYTYFLSIKMSIIDMTVNNPIFIFTLITVIWFIPGIIVRRFNELKRTNNKKRNQAKAIKKLYPESNNK